ncbi:MAG: exonuclease SbcCD subunit D [Eubacterium sp.]
MRLIHLSDLHLGKRVNEFSMVEDQRYILRKILKVIDEEKPEGVMIAGDVYDKSVPNEEAVKLLGGFLSSLAKRKLQVFIISGNHDSAVKLAFASDLIDRSGIHFSPVYDGIITPFKLEKDGKIVNIYMLPFVRPITVKTVFPEEAEEIKSYSDACRVAIDHMVIDKNKCNILIAHQFVTGASRSDSEEMVGGLDNVDTSVFDAFDYVALGHIHGPQRVGRDTIRYSGTPLKYSFSEVNHHKSVTILDIEEKEITIRTTPLIPKHDMREIRGTFEELINPAYYMEQEPEDYLHITLTDEEDIPDAMGKLRKIYPNLMKLSYDNTRTRKDQLVEKGADVEHKQPIELFEELYEMQNNQPMNEEQRAFVDDMIKMVWKGC